MGSQKLLMTQNTRMPLASTADSTQKEMLSREEKFYIKLVKILARGKRLYIFSKCVFLSYMPGSIQIQFLLCFF